MKAITAVLSFSFLTIVIASSFSSDAYAVRRGAMSGYDNTLRFDWKMPRRSLQASDTSSSEETQSAKSAISP